MSMIGLVLTSAGTAVLAAQVLDISLLAMWHALTNGGIPALDKAVQDARKGRTAHGLAAGKGTPASDTVSQTAADEVARLFGLPGSPF